MQESHSPLSYSRNLLSATWHVGHIVHVNGFRCLCKVQKFMFALCCGRGGGGRGGRLVLPCQGAPFPRPKFRFGGDEPDVPDDFYPRDMEQPIAGWPRLAQRLATRAYKDCTFISHACVPGCVGLCAPHEAVRLHIMEFVMENAPVKEGDVIEFMTIQVRFFYCFVAPPFLPLCASHCQAPGRFCDFADDGEIVRWQQLVMQVIDLGLESEKLTVATEVCGSPYAFFSQEYIHCVGRSRVM